LLCFRKTSSYARAVRPIILLTAFALFMALPLSKPIWRVLTPLQQTQFPWRWLGIVSMGASIITAAALPLVFNPPHKLDRPKRILILGAMCVSIVFTLSHVVREAHYLGAQRFENMLSEVRGTPSVNYWIPVWAHSNAAPMKKEVEVTGREISLVAWNPEQRRFSVAAGPASEARVRTFYYPHWKATSNGQSLLTHPDADGALLIALPANTATIDLEFCEPVRTRRSNLVSLAGALLIGGFAIPTRWRRR